MDQSPWSRKVPPKPPSSPIDRTGLGGSPNTAPRQTPSGVSPPNRPSSSSAQPNNAIQYKSIKAKRSTGAPGPGIKRVASAVAAVVLFVGVAFLINGVLVV